MRAAGARAGRRLPSVPAVRLSSRRSDADADVIRARLRALLEERAGRRVGAGRPSDERPWPTTAPHGPLRRDRGSPDGRGGGGLSGTAGRASVGIARPGAPPAGTPGAAAPGRSGSRAWSPRSLLAGWTWLERPQVEPAPAAPVRRGALGGGRRRSTPPVGEAAETSAAVVVSVVGLVVRPGLVTLPGRCPRGRRRGGRRGPAAGGRSGVGQSRGPRHRRAADRRGRPGRGGRTGRQRRRGAGAAPGPGGRVDLNAASAAELDALPGIGPVLAQRIVDHRTRHGPFSSVDQLDDVPGIGPAIAAELAELVAV